MSIKEKLQKLQDFVNENKIEVIPEYDEDTKTKRLVVFDKETADEIGIDGLTTEKTAGENDDNNKKNRGFHLE